MMILSLFANLELYQIITIILLSLFTLCVWSVKYWVLKKFNIIDLAVTVVVILTSVIYINIKLWLVIGLIVISVLNLAYSVYDLISLIFINTTLLEKTTDYLKNNEYDFYIQIDEKERIINCSNTFLKLTKMSKKDILKNKGWKFIFDCFDVKTLNKEEFSLNNASQLIREFNECNSKHKIYKFSMESSLVEDNLENESILYDCIIQPIFFGKKLIGRNVYFYQDKYVVVEKLKEIVRNTCIDLEDSSAQLDLMMSMSEGIIMYYDFQNKVYVATDCFCAYTKTTKKEYKFHELFSHIHPEDVPKYYEQAETVNSLAVTKIHYRLSIGGIYYEVEEDSIYMRKDYGLISIIRIAERGVSQSAPQNAKVRKNVEVLNNLAETDILSKLDQTTKFLDHVLGDEKNED